MEVLFGDMFGDMFGDLVWRYCLATSCVTLCANIVCKHCVCGECARADAGTDMATGKNADTGRSEEWKQIRAKTTANKAEKSHVDASHRGKASLAMQHCVPEERRKWTGHRCGGGEHGTELYTRAGEPGARNYVRHEG